MGSPTDWKLTGSQRLTYRSESSEPHIKLTCGALALGERAPRASVIEGQWGLCAGVHGIGGNGDPNIKRHTQTFTCTGSQGKAKSPQESGSNLTPVIRGPPGKTGVSVACCGGKTWETMLLGILSSMPFSGGGHFGKNLAPPISTEMPQAKQQSRWDHSPTHH